MAPKRPGGGLYSFRPSKMVSYSEDSGGDEEDSEYVGDEEVEEDDEVDEEIEEDGGVGEVYEEGEVYEVGVEDEDAVEDEESEEEVFQRAPNRPMLYGDRRRKELPVSEHGRYMAGGLPDSSDSSDSDSSDDDLDDGNPAGEHPEGGDLNDEDQENRNLDADPPDGDDPSSSDDENDASSEHPEQFRILLQEPYLPMQPMDLQYLLSDDLAPVQKVIIQFLEPYDIVALRLTAVSFQSMNGLIERTQYDFNGLLSRFLNDPIALRRLMASSRAIMWGDITTAFIFRHTLGDGHITISMLNGFREAFELLLTQENFYHADWEPSLWFKQTGELGRKWINIWLKPTGTTPESKCLHAAVGTCDLNFFTWNKFYSLFPCLTFQRKESLLLTQPITLPACISKIADTYGCYVIPRLLDENRDVPMGFPRRIGDRKTWVRALGIQGLENESEYDHALDVELGTFRLKPKFEDNMVHNDLNIYQMSVSYMSNGAINYPYMIPDWDDTLDENGHRRRLMARFHLKKVDLEPLKTYLIKVGKIAQILRDYTILGLMKLPAGLRPPALSTYPSMTTLGTQAPRAFNMFNNQAIPAAFPLRDAEVRRLLKHAGDELLLAYSDP